MNKTKKKLGIQTESIRVLSHLDVSTIHGGVAASVGCLTKDKYTGCPACPGQGSRIFCDP
jgi:hypothetical protein